MSYMLQMRCMDMVNLHWRKKLHRQVVQKCMGIMCIQQPVLVPALQFQSSDHSLFQGEAPPTNEEIRKLLAIR